MSPKTNNNSGDIVGYAASGTANRRDAACPDDLRVIGRCLAVIVGYAARRATPFQRARALAAPLRALILCIGRIFCGEPVSTSPENATQVAERLRKAAFRLKIEVEEPLHTSRKMLYALPDRRAKTSPGEVLAPDHHRADDAAGHGAARIHRGDRPRPAMTGSDCACTARPTHRFIRWWATPR